MIRKTRCSEPLWRWRLGGAVLAAPRVPRPRSVSVVLGAAVCAFTLLTLGCDHDRPPLYGCDTRLEACQERVAAELSRVRGGPRVDLPPIEVISEAELRERYGGETMAPTPEEALSIERWGRTLMLLQLVESPAALLSGSLEDFVTNVAGFYDPSTGVITLIDRGVPTSFESATFLLAHELTHYAQDIDTMAGFGLHEGLARSLDNTIALKHHGEGEAEVVANLVMASLRNEEIPADVFRAYFADWLAGFRRTVADASDPYLLVQSRASYAVGGAYLTDAWLAGGAGGLRGQWSPAILETASWMRGYDSRVSAEPLMECDFPSAPQGYTAWADDALGGEMLFAMLLPEAAPSDASLAASWSDAATWRGDHLRVYLGEAGDPAAAPVALAYRVRADTDASARAIAARLTAAQSELVYVQQEGRDVLLLASEDQAAWEAWSYPLGCAGLPMGVAPARMRSIAERLPARAFYGIAP